jgi:predicted DNA-binding transcriptional regulator AlpA
MARRLTRNRRTRSAATRASHTAPAKRTAPPITLDQLPPDVVRRRLLDTAEAAEFCKLSIPHWRRLYRTGKVPRPVRLSARKYGWRLGDLLDFIDARVTGT